MTPKPTTDQVIPVFEARYLKGVPTDCCDYAVISHATGKEVCRVWERDDCVKIAALLNDQVIPENDAAPIDGGLNQPSSVIPERPTAPGDGGLSELIARLDGLDAKRTKGPWYKTTNHDGELAIGAVDDPLYVAVFPKLQSDQRDFIVALENAWPTIRSALAASAPSCLVGEKEFENCADLSGANQQEPRSSTESE